MATSEYSRDFEKFMLEVVAKQETALGALVSAYFQCPMIAKPRASGSLFASKDWGTYDVRDSGDLIVDDGWAHILVFQGYSFEKHHRFRCAFSNLAPSFSDSFRDKPVVAFVSKALSGFECTDRGSFFELGVHDDSVPEALWRQKFAGFILSHSERLNAVRSDWVDSLREWLTR